MAKKHLNKTQKEGVTMAVTGNVVTDKKCRPLESAFDSERIKSRLARFSALSIGNCLFLFIGMAHCAVQMSTKLSLSLWHFNCAFLEDGKAKDGQLINGAD